MGIKNHVSNIEKSIWVSQNYPRSPKSPKSSKSPNPFGLFLSNPMRFPNRKTTAIHSPKNASYHHTRPGPTTNQWLTEPREEVIENRWMGGMIWGICIPAREIDGMFPSTSLWLYTKFPKIFTTWVARWNDFFWGFVWGFERDFGLASEQWQLWSWVQDQWISLVQT